MSVVLSPLLSIFNTESPTLKFASIAKVAKVLESDGIP